MVYDPDSDLVCDLVACEDAHASERAAVALLLADARPGKLWIADRHFCMAAILAGLEGAGSCFIVREHGRHPKLAHQGEWQGGGCTGTGKVREQGIAPVGAHAPWRRVELALDQPTADGDTTIRLWSNLPGEIDAGRIAELYRKRWRVEGMFGRLERVLNSEVASLGHPRAALPCFATSVLTCNVLALLARCVEQADQPSAHEPPLQVSAFHLAQQVKGTCEGLLIAVPPEAWPSRHKVDPAYLAERLLALARNINPRTVATSKRSAKPKAAKGYVDDKTARAHVATARVLAQAKTTP